VRRIGGRAAQTAVFARAASRYWLGVFPQVCRELARWRARAGRIEDPVVQRLALEALGKRGNIEGAAAFAAFVPRARRGAVVRALVAYQAAYNHADLLAEQPSEDPVGEGRRLHAALLLALDTGAAQPDHDHRGRREDGAVARHDGDEPRALRDDGGYLRELTAACRAELVTLPSYPAVAEPARRAAARIVCFQSMTLGRLPRERAALERRACACVPPGTGLRWWEAAAAAGSSLLVHALIAAAAEPTVDPRELAALERAHFPWIGALHSLLDSLVDEAEDAQTGQLSLVGCYPAADEAAHRLGALAAQAMRHARELPHGRRQALLVAAIAGFYLSAPEASAANALPVTRAVLEEIGGLARPTLLIFRARRVASGSRRHSGAGFHTRGVLSPRHRSASRTELPPRLRRT